MTTSTTPAAIRGVLFDFGGVIAREGFIDTLIHTARGQGLQPERVIQAGVDAMYGSGFLTNTADETAFWQRFEELSGLKGDREAMREAILSSCTPRQEILALVSALAVDGKRTGILSDHTHWLDELERRHGFFMHFEYVFNSFHTGTTKRQPETFQNALQAMGLQPEEVLFIDDARRNIALAREVGLHAIHFEEDAAFAGEFQALVPSMAPYLAPFRE